MKPTVRFAILVGGLTGMTLNADATSLDNGGPGGYRRQPPPVPPVMLWGQTLVEHKCGYESQIVTIGESQDWISDAEFYRMVRDTLAPGGAEKYDSLVIHLSQCFTGGMLDEFQFGTWDDLPADVDNVSINASSRWFRPSAGRQWAPGGNWPWRPRNFFGYAWNHALYWNSGLNMLQAYQLALVSPRYPQDVRHQEGPQYFSKGNADGKALHSGADRNKAILFVGNDQDQGSGRASRHLHDAQRLYHTLIEVYHYAPADITVLYHDGLPPPFAPAPDTMPMPIHAAATKANFLAALTNIGAVIGGQNDQVFIWTSDHGSISPGCKGGRFQPRRSAARGGEAYAELELDLSTCLQDLYNGESLIAQPVFILDDVVVPPGSSPLTIYVNDNVVVGDVTTPLSVEFDSHVLSPGPNRVRFSAFGPDAESIEIGNFGFAVVAYTVSDCNGNTINDDDDIISGTSQDCNTNGEPDECELQEDCNANTVQDICGIASGLSQDCNSNAIPDECETQTDCNANGTADICDVASGMSADCNENAILDECEQSGPLSGFALTFDGVNDFVGVPGFGAIAPNTEVTVEFWQKVDAVRQQLTMTLGATPNTLAVYSPWSDGKVYWDFGDINGGGRLSYTPTDPIVGSWQHFAMVASQSGNTMRIYRNGVLEASKPGMDPRAANPAPLRIGSYHTPNYFFGGLIDEVRIWNMARTQAAIQSTMNTTLSGEEAGLLGYWRLDEGSGMLAADSAGNSDGSLVNGPAWTALYSDYNGNSVPDECESCGEDADGDGDVDLSDYVGLTGCMNGPGGGLGAGCECFDLDVSGDVDLIDFAEFQALFTGNPEP